VCQHSRMPAQCFPQDGLGYLFKIKIMAVR
jgi:hypothetical protein